ncbi:MAG: hydantoinase/oxoprolinase family protein, partial [Candidatus Dormiibacterota bacterium]
DVGGTSADIGVIRAGRPVLSSEEHIADFPLLIPTVAVSSIGAGGGSVIWSDRTGTLKVGPKSAGASPGPVSYGSPDATQPALTDAFLQAGILAPEQRLGGRLGLQAAPAARALHRLGEPLGFDADEVADAAIRIAIAMLAAESTNVLARRGVDVPAFRMVGYGGAGPIVAALLAEAVHIDEVLIPTLPGALSALGAARAQLEGDLVEPVYSVLGTEVTSEVQAALARLLVRVETWLAEETATLALNGSRVEIAAEMRYGSQGYDVTVPLDPAWLREGTLDRVAVAFHRAHERAFGHADEHAEVRLQELRAHITGQVASPPPANVAAGASAAEPLRRNVRIGGTTHEAEVHRRDTLAPGAALSGPAIVEQMDTTTLVPPGWRATVLGSGAIALRRER